MAARNDVTGDSITTKSSSSAYRDNWKRIFGEKNKTKEPESDEQKDEEE